MGKVIGTRNESSLHRTLKFQYTGPKGKTEAEIGEFVADGVRTDGEYIEVQTGSFAPLKKKVKALSKNGKIRIIHPIAVNKFIEVYQPKKTGSGKREAGRSHQRSRHNSHLLLYKRKSPKKGTLWNLFDALMRAPELALLKGVTIEVVLADITEIRLKDGKGSWRRKGISIKDRALSAWHESIVFKKPSDYLRFVPFKKNEEFGSALFAQRAGVERQTAVKALYTLTKMKIVKRTGKQGNSWFYRIK